MAYILARGSGGYGFAIRDNGQLLLSRIGFDTLGTTIRITDTNFHHIAVTKSGTTVVFYVDGVAHPAPAYGSVFAASTVTTIGFRHVGRDGFFGIIDEVSVYNRALNATEIRQVYDAGSDGKCLPPAPPASVCTGLAEGVISWWRLEDSSDYHGTNNGVVVGDAHYAEGRVGNGLVLDGDGDGINVGPANDLSLQTLTIEGWIRRFSSVRVTTHATGIGYILARGANSYGFSLHNDGRLMFSKIGFNTVSAPVRILDTNFHHVAVTKEGTSIRFYIDGEEYPIPGEYTHLFNPSSVATIGMNTTHTESFLGSIDELSIYNRALSSAEVVALFEAGSAGKCTETPTILQHPVSQRVPESSNPVFEVFVDSQSPVRYQWLFNDEPLVNATNSSLALNNVQFTDAGNYSVLVSTVAGATLSSNAVLVVNHVPVAHSSSSTTSEDQSIVINLAGADFDSDLLTFSVVAAPLHGSLVVSGTDAVYTPRPNYNGPDSFAYVANDGLADSDVAVVDLQVLPINDQPVAHSAEVSTSEDTPLSVMLSADDIDQDALTYIVSGPAHGTLTGILPNVVYHPPTNFFGSDSFSFHVNDGILDSITATVSINVAPVNDPPVAHPQSVSTSEDTAINIALSATDVEGEPVTYIVASPSHGTVSGVAPNLTYTPNADFHGQDSFSFHASDGLDASGVAVVSITVHPVNDPPVASPSSVVTDEDQSVEITLNALDVDGNSMIYIVGVPAHGTLSGVAPHLTYSPDPDFSGTDSFSFQVNDGSTNSHEVSVNITVRPVNDAPVAIINLYPLSEFSNQDEAVIIAQNQTSARVILDGSDSYDPESDPLQFTWLDGLNVIGSAPVVTNNLLIGIHTITLILTDGTDDVSQSMFVRVMSPTEAVTALMVLVGGSDLPGNTEKSVLTSLASAAKSFDRDNMGAGINQLEAFQNKVRAQIAPGDPELASELIAAAQALIDAISNP